MDTFTTIANFWIKDCLLFKVTPLTNIPSRNNKIILEGYYATDNIKTATLMKTIFVALEQIHKRNNIKVLIQNISCGDLKNRCPRDFPK